MLFAPKEKGQGLVEYALILVLVAIVVIAVLMLLGPIIANVFSTINTSLSSTQYDQLNEEALFIRASSQDTILFQFYFRGFVQLFAGLQSLALCTKGDQMKTINHIEDNQPLSGHPAKLQRGERGQSLVELAISLTVIMVLLAGAVDFSMAYFSFSSMQDAAQEGALYGSINPTDVDGIKTRVRNASSNPVDLSDVTLVDVFVTTDPVVDPCEGGEVKVDVVYDYPISMPFIGTFIGSQTITLTASVTDTILQPVCSSP